jgi:NAD(P)-dependent dehydrogenase (short-subunit alcohol dehydrogenase family)
MSETVYGPHAHPDSYPPAALVTGSGRRIGRAVALALAEDGWALALHYNTSTADTKNLCEEIKARGGKAITLQANLAIEEETRSLLPRATVALGPIGLLINNASIFENDTIANSTRESWDSHMEPNLRAPFALTQDFALALPADAGGLVVNLLDERVLALPGSHLSYSLSKAGLWALTRSLAIALAPRIRVVGIGPGYCLPERNTSDEDFQKAVSALPLGRSGPPSEVCAALRFFISCKSVTGQMLALDSGNHLIRRPPEDPF